MGTEVAHVEDSPAESVQAGVALTSAPQSSAGRGSPVLNHILHMADHYRTESLTRQAAEMYFMLLDRCCDAPEGARAREHLLEIAEEYENAGERHQARGIYERLL